MRLRCSRRCSRQVSMGTNFERYRVKAGTKVDLRKEPTRGDDAYGGDKDAGYARLDALRDEIAELQDRLYAEEKHKVLIVLQAMDTAGKDSTIRDVFKETNPQGVRVASFGRPTDEELAHDYLWRVHKYTPAAGHIRVFNRSHYEDVLVVRVNELVPEGRWKRRYGHIRDFERLLVDEGTTIRKFFLHISKDEQRERLEERLDIKEKHWKFESGDLRVRERWDDYMAAYADAIEETSTVDAPWYIIPSDRRWYRKLAVAEIVLETLKDLDPKYPDPPDNLHHIAIPD